MANPPPIESLDEIDSTNAEARRRAETGAAGPLWITAKRQTAGRGRRGRSWETGEGNLAATLLMVSDRPAAEVAQLSFVAALSVADLAGAYVPASLVTLKWPNDPMIAGKKAAGILVESGQHLAGGLWLAVGIGVNLATPPARADRPATAFAEHMIAPPPSPILALSRLVEAFERWRELWERLGFPPIADAWTARAHGIGETCEARLPSETIIGVAEGLDADGALRLRTRSGIVRRITAGEVFFGGV